MSTITTVHVSATSAARPWVRDPLQSQLKAQRSYSQQRQSHQQPKDLRRQAELEREAPGRGHVENFVQRRHQRRADRVWLLANDRRYFLPYRRLQHVRLIIEDYRGRPQQKASAQNPFSGLCIVPAGGRFHRRAIARSPWPSAMRCRWRLFRQAFPNAGSLKRSLAKLRVSASTNASRPSRGPRPGHRRRLRARHVSTLCLRPIQKPASCAAS